MAIATKYYLATLGFVLLTVVWLNFRRRSQQPISQRVALSLIGLLAVPAAFILSTPYFFADFPTAYANLSHEARSSHPAFESFSPAGNFIWYITEAIPRSVGSWQTGLVVVGVVLLFLRRKTKQLILLEFVLIFLTVISLSGLHWQRWTIQILPIAALFVDFALTTFISLIVKKRHLSQIRFC